MLKARLSLIFFLACSCLILQAQTFKHPYSFYGIGIPEDQATARNAGMAGISVSGGNEFSYSPVNPATYSLLNYTNFSMSVRGKIFNLSQDTIHSWSNLFSFAHFGLGFPISKKLKWNASFGLQPLSRTGYKSVFSIEGGHDTLDFTEKFELTGGFSKAYLGSSVKLFRDIYAGVNLNYIFGNTHVYHSMLFDDELALLGFISEKNNFFGNIGFDFGLHGKFKLNENNFLFAGGYFSPSVKFNISNDEVVTNFLNEDSKITFKDTILMTNQISGNFSIPLKYGAGLSVLLNNRLFAGIDYKFEKWSSFSFPGITQNLADQHEFSLGGEYTPNNEDLNYFRRVTYRAGIKYALTYLNVPVNLDHTPMQSENLNKAALTIGAGFPIRKTSSFIDVAIEAGKTGRLYEDIIREYYFLINVGFRFNDNWFIKAKYE